MSIYAAPTYALGADYVMLPGSRLEVSSSGQPYQQLGGDQVEKAIKAKSSADASKAMSDPNERAAAQREIARMRRSLRGWLNYRRINDEAAAGVRKAKSPAFLLRKTLKRDRDWKGEQKLADDLHLLLSHVYPESALPSASVTQDPNAAVKLAEIALGKAPAGVSAPTAQGVFPILILAVGGVILFTATSYISNRAEVQKEKEHYACIKSGACTDYGFWMKAAGVTVLFYFAWEKLGVKGRVQTLRKQIAG